MGKLDFLFVTVLDILFYISMGIWYHAKIQDSIHFNFINSIFFYFTCFLIIYGTLTFIITTFKSNYRQVILPYIGLKTFYTTVNIIFLLFLFYRWVTTFENWDNFTMHYVVKSSISLVFGIIFFIMTIRQISQLRNGEFSQKQMKEELLKNSVMINSNEAKA